MKKKNWYFWLCTSDRQSGRIRWVTEEDEGNDKKQRIAFLWWFWNAFEIWSIFVCFFFIHLIRSLLLNFRILRCFSRYSPFFCFTCTERKTKKKPPPICSSKFLRDLIKMLFNAFNQRNDSQKKKCKLLSPLPTDELIKLDKNISVRPSMIAAAKA